MLTALPKRKQVALIYDATRVYNVKVMTGVAAYCAKVRSGVSTSKRLRRKPETPGFEEVARRPLYPELAA